MSLFQNKYRVESSRLPNWDYSANAVYFITICTANKEHLFGKIKNNISYLSQIGKIAKQNTLEIPKHFPYTEVDALVVMPNHIHLILVLNNMQRNVETLHATSTTKNEFMAGISPKSGSLSTIIRSYKSAVSREARKINPDFNWQSRFHDHIIRTEKSYQKIKLYIEENPQKWNLDMFYNE